MAMPAPAPGYSPAQSYGSPPHGSQGYGQAPAYAQQPQAQPQQAYAQQGAYPQVYAAAPAAYPPQAAGYGYGAGPVVPQGILGGHAEGQCSLIYDSLLHNDSRMYDSLINDSLAEMSTH